MNLRCVQLASLVGVVLGLGLLMGCGGSNDAVDATPSPMPPLPLTLELEVGSANDSDQPIPLTLVLTNTGNTVAEFGMGGAEKYHVDFVVTDESGSEIWRWRQGPQILNLVPVSLAPGESRVFEGEWDKHDRDENVVPSGTYQVVGSARVIVNPAGAGEPFDLTTEPQDIEV